ncbi:unnamed protein product [Didymodactylos carnosus]|uniref:BTB domain-containing protein n=1 Tax=Didymodactylos carnosus TaxID=1234261 RepID=A0A814UGG3_9BILA|nr:unnamed protein product [Didymodactylos carnosus]CAF1175380.1 unnamed protein product [Didymodactylos carnosus]CAF3611545.1 unnamed protein product [Didymodactylos carnosus]CAF3939428.1 unnamed protein product [Didymodactylos carnosus]
MSENENSSQGWKRLEQWVSRVVEYSSQYNETTWSANMIIGEPRVFPQHGDIQGAWAQGDRSAHEFIIVEFARSVYPEHIHIYETYNPGEKFHAVIVCVRNGNEEDEEWETVYETAQPHVIADARIFNISCNNTQTKIINQIRLDLNCSAAGSWCEIDCVKLIGHLCHSGYSLKELSTDLSTLLNDDYFADCTFEIQGRTISSHQNILSVRCYYFELLFEKYPVTNNEPIKITNCSYDTFYQILHFIFTDKIEPVLSYEICIELMRVADEYYLSAIYNHAFTILKSILNKNNVLKIFALTGLFSSEQLVLDDVVQMCVSFVQKNRSEVYSGDDIKNLSKDIVLQLIKLVL